MSRALPPADSGARPVSLVPVSPGTGAHVDAVAPPALRRAITPAAVFAAVRRRWRLALAAGVILAGLAATAVWMLRPDKYTAFALLRVAPAEQKILQQDVVRPQESTAYTRTQLALLRSRPVLRAALRDEKVRQLPIIQKQADPIEWLEKELVVEQVQNTEVVRVSLTARGGGADLAAVVNAVVKAYMDGMVEGEFAAQRSHLDDLQKVYGAAEEKLRGLRHDFQEVTKDLKGSDSKILTLKQQTMLDEYAALKRELGATNTRCRDLDLKVATYRLRLAPVSFVARILAEFSGPPPSAALDALVERDLDSDLRVAAADADAAKIREQLRQFDAVSVNPNSSVRADIQKKLDTAEELARAARAERRPAIVARHQAFNAAAARQQIQEAEVERGVLEKQRDGLQTDVDKLKKSLDKLGLNSVELELKRGEIERSEQFLRAVWEQKERLEAELKPHLLGSARQRVTVLSTAEDASVLNKLGRLQESLGAGVAGLLAGLLAVAAFDLRRNRIHTPTDVSRGLRLRVLGALPRVPTTAGLPAIPSGKAARGVLESVNGLRTALLGGPASPTEGRGLALMVASAAPGEGKTTLAVQLAASFARARRKTLLVDCDLRSPSLHRLFGLPAAAGVCEALTGVVDAASAVRPTGIENLDLLSAGRFCLSAEAGLAQEEVVRRLIEHLRGQYDCVVLDSSPVLLVPDALMVGGCVDGLLLSVRPGVSQAATVYAGYERLTEHRLPVLGVVVNGVPQTESYDYGYGRAAEPPATAG